MKDQNIIIRIPEPCHEDWNKMTPDTNGKFCGSCQKSVFDFSNKTDEEIKDILMHYKDQKVCGRFKTTQIDRPLNLRVNMNEVPRNMSITRMFALAMLLSFGSHLFACYDLQGKMIQGIEMISDEDDKNKKVVGEMVATPKEKEKEKVKEKEKCTQTLKGDVDISMVAGGLRVVYEEPVKEDSTKVVEPKDEERFVKGKMSRPEKVEEKEEIPVPVKDSIPMVPLIEEELHATLVLGGLIAVETVTEEVIVPEEVNTTVEEEAAENLSVENAWTVFPNPAKGDFVISYELKKRSNVRIDVLDLQGRMISNLSQVDQQHTGKYQLPLTLDVPNGVYLISMQLDGKITSKKVIIEH
ncbi:MAG TPA: T9SS type A sorting domain-containing protein [Bacteroidia bacterium]|nr:T9SS type A sorting domain-containing protein [Bacteroidia bacterium]